MTQPKPSDDRIKVDSSFAQAVERFKGNWVPVFRASTMPNPPLRATRAEAEADELAWREREQ